MTSSLAAIPGTIGSLLHVVVLIVALLLIVIRVRGRGRPLGVAGVAIMLAASVVRPLSNVALPAFADGSGMNVILVFQVVNLLFTLVNLVGLALLVAALIAGSTGKVPTPGVSAGWGPSSPGPRPR